MKTIIVGYTDRAALSAPEIICGPETPAEEQAKVMESAVRLHEFPEHISRVEQYLMGEPIQIAIFIDDATAAAAQDIDGKQRKAAEVERARLQERQNAQKSLVVANKAFNSAASKRNSAIAAIAEQKNRLVSAIGEKDKSDILAKIAKLQPAADQATAEFNIVRELRDIVKNPKSSPDDIAAAMKLIADPAKALALKAAAAPETETPATAS
jgi:hypothetical protein